MLKPTIYETLVVNFDLRLFHEIIITIYNNLDNNIDKLSNYHLNKINKLVLISDHIL